ncbi:MAG: ABC transporter permease [Sandaracinaceae bacterium]
MLPLTYSLRSLGRRPARTAMTVLGIALVSALFAAMLAVGSTMSSAFQSTGEPDEIVVTQAGALFADFSNIDRSALAYIQTLDGVATGRDGQPLASPELYFCTEASIDGIALDISVRGVRPIAYEFYREWSLAQGGWPQGTASVAIGASLARELSIGVGDRIEFEGQSWRVEGIFSSAGRLYDRELVTDLDALAAAAQRDDYSAILVRTSDTSGAEDTVEVINHQERERVQAALAPAFYAQSGAMAAAMSGMGGVLALIIALGAVFAGMNTMFSAVANRRRELGTLRALGFPRRALVISLLAEALTLGLIGGMLGAALALLTAFVPVDLPYVVGNSIGVGPTELLAALVLATCVGVLGGFFPALRSARMVPAESMR